jgi:type IV secretion/conjugal transfer VirB4 family ATPase
MLKIQFRDADADKGQHPLQAICPWIDFITPGLILNKDGSLLAAFEYQGIDPDDLFDEQIDSETERMQRAFSRLDARITAWWIVDKRRDYSYANSEFENPAAAKLDKIYSDSFRNGQHYSIRYTLFVLFTGGTGANKFLDRVARIQTETEASLPGALVSAVKESLSGRSAFIRDTGQIRENITVFERLLAAFKNTVPIKLDRLEGDQMSSALGTILNRADDHVELSKPADAMLDSWLPRNWITAGPDTIKFRGNRRNKYMGMVGVKKWPPSTSPMLFETIARMDMELTICQIVRFNDAGESGAAINEAIEYYELTKFGLVAHAISKLAGGDPEASPGKLALLGKCKEARDQIGVDGITFAYTALSICIFGDTPTTLRLNCDTVITALENKKFNALRELDNALPAFGAMLPGQWALQSRYDLISIENIANACPIYTMAEGSRIHKMFSDHVFMRPVPQLTTFGNRYGGRVNFSSHVGQVGHMLIIAPTGEGKSTFVNFCISQFFRYGKMRIYIFDRNRSCEVVTKLHDGDHIDLRKRGTKVNAFLVMQDEQGDGKTWLREYLIRRLIEGGYTPTATERDSIDVTLGQMHRSRLPMSMSRFVSLLTSGRLKKEFAEWCVGGAYEMFDSEVDDLALSDMLTVEMTSIMSSDRLARAFIDLVFRKILSSLDGTPTLIYVEEASFLVNDERFAPIIDGFLKAVRARNGFVWLTIQSPTSITNAAMSASILDNVLSFLLLRNKKLESHRSSYKGNFGFDDHQIDLLGTLEKHREYLLIQDGHSRVLTTDFAPAALAYVRSEKSVLNKFDQHEAEGTEGWQQRYVDEISSMKA